MTGDRQERCELDYKDGGVCLRRLRWDGSCDHLCRVPRCVNPAHLEAVSNRENTLRGTKGDLKTHCAKGHLWVPENIIWRTCEEPPRRKCRICYEDHKREHSAKRRAATAARRAARDEARRA